MRLIDADALIKAIIRKEPFSDCARVVIAECVEEVRHAPTIEPEPKWIPCSERLPIEARHYLCSFNRPNRIDRIYVDLAYWTGGRWYGYMHDQINAWMPLPTAYREEGEK